MPTVSSGGVGLHYDVNGNGEPILFLHGFTATAALWAPVTGIFSSSFRCLNMNLRGHGKSQPGPRDSYTLKQMAADALGVLDAEDIDRAVVVGHSLGGMIAQHLAVSHRNRLSGLVLSSTTCFGPPREMFTPLIEGAIALADMSADERKANPMLAHSVPLDADTAWGCGEAVMGLPRYDEKLADFHRPCLLIYGDQDSPNIVKGSQQLASALPQSHVSIVVGAGHVPQISHTEAYAEALSDYLQDLDDVEDTSPD